MNNTNNKLITIVPLAKRLGVSVEFLRLEIKQGNIPYINAGKNFLFNFNAVKNALIKMAANQTQKAGDINGQKHN